MIRNKEWALRLLKFIEDNDQDGVGLYREELRNMFVNAKLIPGMDEDRIWDYVDYHLDLLQGAGFVVLVPDDENNNLLDSYNLTWSGHDQIAG